MATGHNNVILVTTLRSSKDIRAVPILVRSIDMESSCDHRAIGDPRQQLLSCFAGDASSRDVRAHVRAFRGAQGPREYFGGVVVDDGSRGFGGSSKSYLETEIAAAARDEGDVALHFGREIRLMNRYDVSVRVLECP